MLNRSKRQKEFNSIKRKYFLGYIKNIFSHNHHHEPQKIDQELVKKFPQADPTLITQRIAFVVNGRVADIIVCQDKLAKILLGDVKIIKVPYDQDVKPGWFWSNEMFVEPEQFQPYIETKKTR